MALPINIDELLRSKAGNGNFLATMPIHNKMMHTILEQVKEQLGDRIRIIKVDVDKYGMTANQPTFGEGQKQSLARAEAKLVWIMPSRDRGRRSQLCGKYHILKGRNEEMLYASYIEGKRSYMNITLEIRNNN